MTRSKAIADTAGCSVIPVSFLPFKYGREVTVDSTRCARWSGVVPDGEPHVLDFHELLLIESGSAVLHLGPDRFEVGGASLVLTPPAVLRRVEIRDPMRLHIVVFVDTALKRTGCSAVVRRCPTGSRTLDDVEMGRLTSIADLMNTELTALRHDSAPMLDALLTQLLIRVGRWQTGSGVAARPVLVARFERLLEDRFRQKHHVSWYAAALGVTADHLSATIRESDGRTAKQMIQQRLMREAADLIARTDLTMAEIAATLGYDEPSHFCRAFKVMFGAAPSRFRSR